MSTTFGYTIAVTACQPPMSVDDAVGVGIAIALGVLLMLRGLCGILATTFAR